MGGGCCREITVCRRWLFYRGYKIQKVAFVERLQYIGGCSREVAIYKRWQL